MPAPSEPSIRDAGSDWCRSFATPLRLRLFALQQETLSKVLPLGQFLDLSLNRIENIERVRSHGPRLNLSLRLSEPIAVVHPAGAQDEPEHRQGYDGESGNPRGIDGHLRVLALRLKPNWSRLTNRA